MIIFPALLKLYGDDELIVVSNIQALNDECESLILSCEDYIVDIKGNTYSILKDECLDTYSFVLIGEVTVNDVTALIQAHQFSQVDVCLTKIQFSSIHDAIMAISKSVL